MRFDANTLAKISAEYKTINTLTPFILNGLSLILPYNPKRWYVEFSGFGGVGASPKVYPAPVPTGVSGSTTTTLTQRFKWQDCPSIVTGEWYFWGDGTTQLIITECIYVGNPPELDKE